MRRRKPLVALAGLAVVVAAGVVVLWPRTAPERITRENYDRIRNGMSRAEVEAILGPPRDYSTGPLQYAGRSIQMFGGSRGTHRTGSYEPFATVGVQREVMERGRMEERSRDPQALPAATSNHCFFCWYVLTRGLAAGVDGGGGQIGNWTGRRPNYSGDLIQLSLSKMKGK
jgi:hypothetical protein